MDKNIFLKKYLENCNMCPRNCFVNRIVDEKGVCNTGRYAMVSSYNLHYGEEPPLSGFRGSGTIFFTGCNLKCIYCQNYPISQLMNGNEVSEEKLAQMMLILQAQGAHNINFVTPSHVIPQIIIALSIAKEKGLNIPIVYNTSSYDKVDSLKLLHGLVDIYLADIRYMDPKSSLLYSSAEDYPEIVKLSIKEMHNQVSDLVVDEYGIASKGLIIRLLILPNDISQTEKALEFIANEISVNTYISLMSQYFPAYRAFEYPEISRRISKNEYYKVKQKMLDLGLKNGWIQPPP